MRLDVRFASFVLIALAAATVTHAQERTSAWVIVRVYNSAELTRDELQGATNTAGEILKSAGVQVTWRECPMPNGPSRTAGAPCAQPLVHSELIVRVVKTGGAATISAETLGYSLVDAATGVGTLSTVLGDRVSLLAGRVGVSPATLLGRVMAHELGHLLLGTLDHAEHGLMRAHWSLEILGLDDRYWVFSVPEVTRIHASLQVREGSRAARVVAAARPARARGAAGNDVR